MAPKPVDPLCCGLHARILIIALLLILSIYKRLVPKSLRAETCSSTRTLSSPRRRQSLATPGPRGGLKYCERFEQLVCSKYIVSKRLRKLIKKLHGFDRKMEKEQIQVYVEDGVKKLHATSRIVLTLL
ncbi:hypothetical protein EVAR_4839_1 [Eumeta japonica]|uniref:Uncharacterized protein n=1 Tax=Eumeta variegata TaxID=151549 RepID=A0A4C1T201_EUMVA|nr:hypothetical protein EVAR_4839_1 [Eumeta japonica]